MQRSRDGLWASDCFRVQTRAETLDFNVDMIESHWNFKSRGADFLFLKVTLASI